jgi:TonB family protein
MIESARGPAMSVTIHCAAVALLFLAGANSKVQQAVLPMLDRIRLISPYVPPGPGGGGSGDRSPLPASKGRLPRIAPRQFTPPAVVIHNMDPKLPMEPTLVISADVKLPQLDILALGDPYGKNGPPSNGTGKGGGIGDGEGTGIGPGKGPGVGPGEGGDTGGGRLHGFIGASTAPVVLFQVEPEFSEEARKAKLQGVVMLYGEVDTNGRLRNIRVTRRLGLGLEEKAIEAVKQWRFRPGTRDGKPVVAAAAIEVNFHLL